MYGGNVSRCKRAAYFNDWMRVKWKIQLRVVRWIYIFNFIFIIIYCNSHNIIVFSLFISFFFTTKKLAAISTKHLSLPLSIYLYKCVHRRFINCIFLELAGERTTFSALRIEKNDQFWWNRGRRGNFVFSPVSFYINFVFLFLSCLRERCKWNTMCLGYL